MVAEACKERVLARLSPELGRSVESVWEGIGWWTQQTINEALIELVAEDKAELIAGLWYRKGGEENGAQSG